MKFRSLFLIILLLLLFCCKDQKKIAPDNRILIITTLFPLYDFCKHIGKDKVRVELLLPPGVDAHNFEPKPEDIVKISRADIFVYTGKEMERWAEKIIRSTDNKKLLVIDTSRGVLKRRIAKKEDTFSHNGHFHNHEIDPHIWLDFENAKVMIDNILEGVIAKDVLNREFYIENANSYKKALDIIDEKYKQGLKNCKNKYFYHAGHFAFGYLTERYGLKYISAYQGLSPDEEPTPKRIAEMIDSIKKHNIKYVFYEELMSPRIANVLSMEAGVSLLKINPAHNVSKDDLDRGISFLEIMENNLKQFRMGLECQ
ncbi:MAG: zinc ABC transporter substrate-binding protein [Proteobacteria bacterium]|nr:zinc ABC transporter substrate-binding protein [Pseudomonadota bacterium]